MHDAHLLGNNPSFPGRDRIVRRAESLKEQEEVWAELHGDTGLYGDELLRHLPARLLEESNVIENIVSPRLFAIAGNVHLTEELAARLIRRALSDTLREAYEGGGDHDWSALDILWALARRGFPVAAGEVRDLVKQLPDASMRRAVGHLLLSIPSPAVNEGVLLRLWRTLGRDVGVAVVMHPMATPQVWYVVATDALKVLRSRRVLRHQAALQLLVRMAGMSEAAGDERVAAVLLASNREDVLAPLLEHLSGTAFLSVWRHFIGMSGLSGKVIAEVLGKLGRERLSMLEREDIAVLLSHAYAEVRVAGLRVFGDAREPA